MSMNETSIWAVIPAAGTGSRMQSEQPKQYLPLLGRPVLEYSLQLFLQHPAIEGVVVALSSDDPYWQDIDATLRSKVICVDGGAERSDSVLNAVKAIDDPDAWVLVHDAARPCLTAAEIDDLLAQRREFSDGAVLGVPVVDTLKRAQAGEPLQIDCTVSREALFRAMTPQMAPLQTLLQAYEQCAQQGIKVTDEAQALESSGRQLGIVVGRADNIKITYPDDIALAEFYLRQQINKGLRVEQDSAQ